MLAGRQHADHESVVIHGLGRAGRLGGALVDRRLDRGIRQVERRNAMLRLAEIGGHRPAHVAETDKGDFRHGSLPLPAQSNNRSFDTGLKCASTMARVTPSMVGGFHLGFWSFSISSARTPSQ